MIDSWNALTLIKPVIDLYTGMRGVIDLCEGSFIVEYKHVWYILTDNGGEITIQKINDAAYHRDFPTTWFDETLNVETLMYRLLATLDDRAIDYRHRENLFLHILMAVA